MAVVLYSSNVYTFHGSGAAVYPPEELVQHQLVNQLHVQSIVIDTQQRWCACVNLLLVLSSMKKKHTQNNKREEFPLSLWVVQSS